MRGNPGLKGRLLENSIEAYVMALETINRLSIKYRMETFAYLICNAWELMLKAKIIQDSGDRETIYYEKKRGEPRRSLTLRDCLKTVFQKENDPTRRNVELVADLRDEATHLVISQVPKDVLALFQACVLNYHKRLNEWWDISLSDRVPVGMMTIVYDLRPDQLDLNSPTLRRRLGADAARYLMEFEARLRQESEDLGRSVEFSIPVNYKLALVKDVGDADISLTTGGAGETVGVLKIPKDPSTTHPYRQTELIKQVNKVLEGTTINKSHVECVVKSHSVKKKSNFYYQGKVKNSPGQYSHEFVEWIAMKHRQDRSFFEKARQKANSLRAKAK